MKHALGWALSLSILSGSWVMAASDFSSMTRGIAEQQSALDRALLGMGVRSPSAAALSGVGATPDQGVAPLFQVHSELKRLQASAGRFLFGKVIQKLVVGTEGAPVIVELAADQGTLSGLRLMGTARPSSGGDRIAIEFSRILFRGGSTGAIQAVALDESGALGVPAYVMSQKALSVMGAVASSFISGVAASQQTLVPNAFGFQATQPTGRNAILQGLSQTAADQSKRLIEEATTEKPVLILEPSTEISILVQEEVRF
jgi:hypothetical protein